ncbi:hypothetical protein LOCC1_G001813 [Lachnellula occidentalis]|uniref:Myb-like DNA-binding domain-containing protein n=1 Tax=Lachnellula occidentalis TaxID=215460 RepID=A0A8H8S3M0_9HELO|nr:hypothetical protein LOCC1_G001813 [Lachnellula occidentalis]
MSQAITFTEADQALMVAIINQLGTGKIDRKQLQLDLGLSSIGTADARLSRFKAKLAKAKGDAENSPAPAKAKRASPAKKRKLEVEEDTEEHEDGFEDGNGMADDKPMVAVDTPTRKGSARKARGRSIKEELDEVDYAFQDSGDIWE